mmetsp:Transcript_24077/g.62039  ORF Transcript_24077/g.62039 Transcript_24077/m.62039 type:complete len:253 (+) Transcript_24077:1360-2118(+)
MGALLEHVQHRVRLVVRAAAARGRCARAAHRRAPVDRRSHGPAECRLGGRHALAHLGGRARRRAGRGVRRAGQRQLEPQLEQRAGAGAVGSQGHLAARPVQREQLPHDAQPESSAAVALQLPLAHLLEQVALLQRAQLGLVKAHAAVAHADAHHARAEPGRTSTTRRLVRRGRGHTLTLTPTLLGEPARARAHTRAHPAHTQPPTRTWTRTWTGAAARERGETGAGGAAAHSASASDCDCASDCRLVGCGGG